MNPNNSNIEPAPESNENKAAAAETKILPRSDQYGPIHSFPGHRELEVGETIAATDFCDAGREGVLIPVASVGAPIHRSDAHWYFRPIPQAPVESIQKPEGRSEAEGWYCPKCKTKLSPIEVTFGENHDPRYGGCGEYVGESTAPQAPEGTSPGPSLHVLLNNLEAAATHESQYGDGPNARRLAARLEIARAEVTDHVAAIRSQVSTLTEALTKAREALKWFVDYVDEHEEWQEDEFPEESPEKEWLDNVRALLESPALVKLVEGGAK